ncbi:peptidase domain-containing ABC transporter [Pseudoduganella violacea]|uniref:Cyclolysin secretion/processing ATP-binding protein CyaB n=1 Tax=Pseudoduganella violacea TaxID=1715466 RepID=A0A7W5BDE1_9BURK|nr:peptidase domain-containing ABC transporter [Pseudoduganella violacea]MBB3121074.1 ATP-binding cassette subfamily B protein RaxB [Pseudoduganella violacea]
MKVILQSESSECGLACLAMIANRYGFEIEIGELRRRFSVSLKGATLAQIIRHSSSLGFASRPLRLEINELSMLQLPCILHWNLNHFIVLKKVSKDLRGRFSYHIVDPAIGERKLRREEISSCFTGVALELTPTPSFKRIEKPKSLKILDLTGPVIGLKKAAVQIVLLAMALEVFSVISPLFNQYVIDEVIVSSDQELLTTLVIGFGILLIIQNLIGFARSWFLMRWGMSLNFQWGARIFYHLTKLPVSYFEKRHVGDIVSRFSSTGAIQVTLSSIFLESALDGLMAIVAFCMMLLYSPKLTLLICISIFLYTALRAAFYSSFRAASQERLVLSSKENSYFLETIRAISPLKLFCREDNRRSKWLNLRTDVMNRDIKTQKISLLFKVFSTLIFGTQNLLLFYVGGNSVMQGSLTVGMLMAFSSYSNTFSSRALNLVDLFTNMKMLSLHCERLGDIVMEEIEEDPIEEFDISKIGYEIQLKDVKFRYAEGEPWILDGITMTIPPGQKLALVGDSGCGKTTLCKIILGLLKPIEGEILLDGVPIRKIGMNTYRKQVGTVMQDDVLLAGSIQENVSFFDTLMDVERVVACCKAAAIHDEISAMPMAYYTLVGDMGSSLSGGQKQRILLARAFYKNPKILILDEATSHLDINNEKNIISTLRKDDFTQIMIAHRPEVIQSAHRIIKLQDGKISEIQFLPELVAA